MRLAGLVLLSLIALSFVAFVASAEETLVKKIIVIRIMDDEQAVNSLIHGETQARLFRIRNPELVRKALGMGFKAAAPLSGLVDILVNPVPCKDGSFNPFTIREVRYALNFLINRKEIVSSIFRGTAVEAIIPYAPVDPDYIQLLPVAAKYEVLFAKGEKYARKLIEEGMKKAGAVFRDGKWYYKGKPVVIKFVIRIEDERKQIGEYLAKKLEEMGFTVEKLYKDFRGAFEIVYGDDPGKCSWHLYTEGWGFTGLTKYDHDTAVAFYSSIYGYLPGWGTEGYAQYIPKEIDEVAKKLVKGEYKSVEEYWELYRKLVDLGVKDSVRVFVAWTRDFYLVDPKLSGILESPKAAPWDVWTYMNLRYVKPEVKLSNRYVYSEGWPWNPVGGFQDFYSVLSVANAIYLPGITSKPTTGETGWSIFATWKVKRGPVKIPEDAITWDTEKHEWVSAGGKVAKNAVIINYRLLGKLKFHDGSTETLADILASIYLILEWSTQAKGGDTRYESTLASLYAPFLESFVAIRIINETAVEVFTNFTHFDDGIVAQRADVWTGTPLELYVAMEKLVEKGKAGWTQAGSKAKGVPALHLVSKEQCEEMARILREMIEKREIPDWVQGLIKLGVLTEDEFFARLQNLIKFYEKYGHMLVGNGPFMLEKYDPQNDAATLVRVENYPISPEEVAKELAKHTAKIEGISVVNEGIIEAAKPGEKVATVTILVDGEPATADKVRVYAMLVSAEGKVYMLNVKCVAPGKFVVTFKEALPAGDYTLVVYAYPAGYNEPDMETAGVSILGAAPATTTPSPTPTPTPTETAAATTVTVTKTVTVGAATVTVTKIMPTTMTVVSPTTVTTGAGANTTMMAGIAIAAFIVGLVIGFFVRRG